MNEYPWQLDSYILILGADYKIILHFLYNPLFYEQIFMYFSNYLDGKVLCVPWRLCGNMGGNANQ